jgi:hypothetical protein
LQGTLYMVVAKCYGTEENTETLAGWLEPAYAYLNMHLPIQWNCSVIRLVGMTGPKEDGILWRFWSGEWITSSSRLTSNFVSNLENLWWKFCTCFGLCMVNEECPSPKSFELC